MEHRADLRDEDFEFMDGRVRGKMEAVCDVCGAELRYEYVLDKIVEKETGEVEYISY